MRVYGIQTGVCMTSFAHPLLNIEPSLCEVTTQIIGTRVSRVHASVSGAALLQMKARSAFRRPHPSSSLSPAVRPAAPARAITDFRVGPGQRSAGDGSDQIWRVFTVRKKRSNSYAWSHSTRF